MDTRRRCYSRATTGREKVPADLPSPRETVAEYRLQDRQGPARIESGTLSVCGR